MASPRRRRSSLDVGPTARAVQRCAMTAFSGQVVIERPAPEVYDFVADERNRYDPRIRRAEKLTQRPVGDGTRFRAVSAIAPPRRDDR